MVREIPHELKPALTTIMRSLFAEVVRAYTCADENAQARAEAAIFYAHASCWLHRRDMPMELMLQSYHISADDCASSTPEVGLHSWHQPARHGLSDVLVAQGLPRIRRLMRSAFWQIGLWL